MNKDIAIRRDDDGWFVDRYAPTERAGTALGGRTGGRLPTLDLQTLLRIVSHWRWLILGAVALGLAAAIVYSLLQTPIYRAAVTLEVNPPRVEVLNEQRSNGSQSQTPWDYVATQAGLLSSRSLAERTAQDLNLAGNPDFVGSEGDAATRLKIAAGKVAAGLKVAVPEEGQLIGFTYETESPVLAARIANGVATAFINSSLQRRYEASAYARGFLEKQIAKTRGDLERSEKQLVAYAQSQGIINTAATSEGTPTDANSLQGESLIALNRALAEAVARRVAAEGAYRQSRSVGPTAEVNESSAALRQSRAALEAEYQDKRTLMKPEHPDMISLRSRIGEIDRQIASENSRVSSGRSNSLLADFRAAASAESALRSRVAGLKTSVLDLRGRSIQYAIYQREVDTNRSLYDALLQRYKEIGVAGGVGAAPVSIVDHADVPGAPYKPNLPINLALGLGLGLIGGLGAAVGLEFLNDTIKTREDVRSKLGLACLGAIPKTMTKSSFVDDLREPGSVVSEAYSAVVTALRFSTESGSPRTLLITSTQASEGKSSTVLAMAQNFSRRGNTVLLIDSDLRKPAFKTANDKVGLTKLLTADEPVSAHVVPTQFENLCLLPCGPLPPNPADLLSTGRFQAILREASELFDVVLVDAPPTLGLADAPLLAAVTGNVMFIVESGRTRTGAAVEAINRIEATGAHILGAVITKSTEAGQGYGYKHYGYGYGKVDSKRTEIVLIDQDRES